MRINKSISFSFLMLLCFSTVFNFNLYSQNGSKNNKNNEFYFGELQRYANSFKLLKNENKEKISQQENFDVNYYGLYFEILPTSKFYNASVRIKGKGLVDNFSQIILNMDDSLRVDSLSGDAVSFTHGTDDLLKLNLDKPINTGEGFDFTIYFDSYKSQLDSNNYNFVFQTHGSQNMPFIWTYSEPIGARKWWPCKDSPYDKADSADIIINVPSDLIAVSNGKLIKTEDDNTRKIYYWHEKYPIATYLISLAISDYQTTSENYTYGNKTMLLEYYAKPEDFSYYDQHSFYYTKTAMDILSDLFGTYPFLDEKYAMVQALNGGGMEHQTATSFKTGGEQLVVHELAHQWFGDMITCKDWNNIWLNESFAQYAQALYTERKYGKNEYLNLLKSWDEEFDLPVYSSIFNYSLVYYFKGAWVLHMLRYIVGDNNFFQILKRYAGDKNLQYKNVTTEDFQNICESVYGSDLSWFFDEWIYKAGRPDYNYSWSVNSSSGQQVVKVSITQAQTDLFIMPIEIFVHTNQGDKIFKVDNNQKQQSYEFNVQGNVSNVTLDDSLRILKNLKLVSYVNNIPTSYKLFQNYPNPFNPSTTINFDIPKSGNVDIKIFDLSGKEIKTLINEFKNAGSYEVTFNAGSFASGVYFYSLKAGNFISARKMLLLK